MTLLSMYTGYVPFTLALNKNENVVTLKNIV